MQSKGLSRVFSNTTVQKHQFFGAQPSSQFSKERKKVKSLSRVQLFETPWIVAYQAPLSMGFSRQEYWSGLLFPSPKNLPANTGEALVTAGGVCMFVPIPLLVAQMVKHLPTMWETWVRPLGQEDPLEKKMQLTPVLLPGKSHGQRSVIGYSLCSRKESDTTEQLHFLSFFFFDAGKD